MKLLTQSAKVFGWILVFGVFGVFGILEATSVGSSLAGTSTEIHGRDLRKDLSKDLRKGTLARISLKEAKKGTVIVFLSAKCPCSASHEPRLNELYQKYHPQGFQFVGIHSNTDESEEFSAEHFHDRLLFPVLQDPGAQLALEWNAYKTPHVFVVNPKSEILFQGGVDNSHDYQLATQHHLRDALESVLAGKPVETKEVRVLGCIIRKG